MATPHSILPIPYVVSVSKVEEHPRSNLDRIPGSIFYAGDTRPHAMKWSGCNRTAMLQPLQDYYSKNASSAPIVFSSSRIHVRLINDRHKGDNMTMRRLSMSEYNRYMTQSQYCFIVCGDTPTSRSLSSAIVHGCIPLFIDIERWYGYCHEPCHSGWGWTILHNETTTTVPRSSTRTTSAMAQQISHFPYTTMIDYNVFPSIDEQKFVQDPIGSVQTVLKQWNRTFTHNSKDHSMKSLERHPSTIQSMFLYGYGNPVTTQQLGNAVPYIWQSFVDSFM
jgi:hypothetical protein